MPPRIPKRTPEETLAGITTRAKKRTPDEILKDNLADPTIKALYEKDLTGSVHNRSLRPPSLKVHDRIARRWGAYVDTVPGEEMSRTIVPGCKVPSDGTSL